MGQRIDQFCEDLRLKLTSIDKEIDRLKKQVEGRVQSAEQDVRQRLEKVQRQVETDRKKVAAAQADLKQCVEDKKAVSAEKVAEWKTKREITKLQNRAERAERSAAAAIIVAIAAVDDAEQASLEAWLARHDADSAQKK